MSKRRTSTAALMVLILACGLPCVADDGPEQAQIDFANGLFQRGFHKDAMGEYKAYLDKFPEGQFVDTALYRLGEAAFAAKEYETALDAFDRVLARQADAAIEQRAMMSRAEVLHALKRPADAILAIEPLTGEAVSPDIRARALYLDGKIHSDSNDNEGALQSFLKLLEVAPEDPLASYGRYQLAFAYMKLNRLEEAATEFANVAASQAEEALRAEARFRSAEIYDRLGWYDAAVKAYSQLREAFPDSDYSRRAEYGNTWAMYHAGMYPEAMNAAKAFIEKSPEAPEAVGMRYLVGNCLQQQKAYPEALGAYREVMAKHPDSEFAPRARYKVAWCLYLIGNLAEAETEAAAFLQARSDESLVGDAAFLLGSILAQQQRYDGAYEEFRLVAEKYPDSEFGAEALYKSGECLAQLNRSDEAAAVFERFATQYPDNPLAEQAILRAGDAELLSSAFEQAVAKYQKILEAPKDPTIERDTLYRLAITYHNMKKYDESVAMFRQIIDKYPDDPHVPEAWVRIGEYNLRDGRDLIKAIDAYNAALTLAPAGAFSGRALKGLALARYDSKDYQAAGELLLKLMQEFPDVTLNEETYAWAGQWFFDQKQWDQAAVALNALLKAVPDYPNPDRVLLKIAECSESAGRPDEALERYQAVVDAAPRTGAAAKAQYQMAAILEAKGEAEKAFGLYDQVANSDTGETAARARFHLGELLEAKGEFDAAARNYMYVVIVFLYEDLSPEALLRAGECFAKARSPDQARKSFEELVRDYPDSPQAAKAREALAKPAGA